jgi:hypothetical protein
VADRLGSARKAARVFAATGYPSDWRAASYRTNVAHMGERTQVCCSMRHAWTLVDATLMHAAKHSSIAPSESKSVYEALEDITDDHSREVE